MTRVEAIKIISEHLKDELVFHANGHICRESFKVQDRKENFYMIGSMGLAPSLALGFIIAKPESRIVIYDGDGSVLMNMGNLASVAAYRPKNFVHIVFDNEAYGSTGDQRTISREVSLERIAEASGYRFIEKVDFDEDLKDKLDRCFRFQEGPVFLLIKVKSSDGDACPRINLSPQEITDRFMQDL